MRSSMLFSAVVVAILAFGAGGCQWTTPYVYKSDEFNRKSEDFGQEPEDRESVEICYNSRSTTPAVIGRMAKEECAKYGKIARFQSHEYLECPIATPVQAIFSCTLR